MTDLSAWWENAPSTATPFEASVLNGWGADLEALRADAVAAKADAEAAAAAAAAPTDATVAALVGSTSSTQAALDDRYSPLSSRAVFNVMDYGAAGDGVADDTAAIQAAVTAAQAVGGGIIELPAGTFNVSATITLNDTGLALIGAGADTSHDVGSVDPTTTLSWVGGAGGTVVSITAVSGASNQNVARCGIRGVGLLGNSVAGVGVSLLSARQCFVDDCYFAGFTQDALLLDVLDVLGESRDTQHCRITNLNFRQHTTVPEGTCIRLAGESAYNSSFNYFENISAIHKDATAYDVGGTDNNVFVMLRANRASGGVGVGVLNRGSVTSGQASTSNYFLHLSAGPGGVVYQGTETAGVTSPAHGQIMFYDVSNGAPLPVIGTGCKVQYHTENGMFWKPSISRLVLADNYASAIAEMANVGSESLRIINGSNNHIVITDGTNAFGLNMSGGDLRVVRLAGTGSFALPSTLKFNGAAVTTGPVDSGGTGFRYLRVPN